ncbi:hypothetical protein GCM10009128_26360 [Psychrosphaera haliotis]|uniref:hypothetical protein n=1 Tax=Psychrosphaera haliotis TaxID=555083 RepID=UPI0031E2B9D0
MNFEIDKSLPLEEAIANVPKKYVKQARKAYFEDTPTEAAIKRVKALLFPEETDFISDSTSEAKGRRVGINPMSKEYQAKVDSKRALFGVSPLTESGMAADKSSLEYSEKLLEGMTLEQVYEFIERLIFLKEDASEAQDLSPSAVEKIRI